MFTEQINACETRMNEIETEVRTLSDAKDMEKLEALTTEYGQLDEKRNKLLKAQNILPVKTTVNEVIDLEGAAGAQGKRSLDPRGTEEYRMAFMSYLKNGEFKPELRADATTIQSDVTAIVPSTIANRVIEEMEEYGEVYARITKSSVKGGFEIPISSLKPSAAWTAESAVSEKKKLSITTKVSFGTYKLQIRIATSLESSVNVLDLFEKQVAKAIARALYRAIEDSVFNGTGISQPTGLLQDARILSTQKFNFLATDATWDGWHKKFLAKVKTAYRRAVGNAFYMAQDTFDTYCSAMVDSAGQPIARTTVGIDGKENNRFLGYPVVIVDYLTSLATAVAGDVIVVFGDLSEFVFNTPEALMYKKYFDDNTDEYIDKLTLLGDGKVADPNGFVFLKHATA
ncbi:MAG: phage major capsid protein [Acholeplasmataceae bacterium]